MEIAASIGMILSPDKGQEFLQSMGLDIDVVAVSKIGKVSDAIINVRDLAGTIAGKNAAQFFQGGAPKKQPTNQSNSSERSE